MPINQVPDLLKKCKEVRALKSLTAATPHSWEKLLNVAEIDATGAAPARRLPRRLLPPSCSIYLLDSRRKAESFLMIFLLSDTP